MSHLEIKTCPSVPCFLYLAGNKCFSTQHALKIGSFPQSSRWKFPKILKKPPATQLGNRIIFPNPKKNLSNSKPQTSPFKMKKSVVVFFLDAVFGLKRSPLWARHQLLNQFHGPRGSTAVANFLAQRLGTPFKCSMVGAQHRILGFWCLQLWEKCLKVFESTFLESVFCVVGKKGGRRWLCIKLVDIWICSFWIPGFVRVLFW